MKYVLAYDVGMLRIGGESGLWPSRQTCRMFLTELSTACAFQIEQLALNVKVRSPVSLRSRIKTRPSELAPPMEIKGQSYSAAVEPSSPRKVKANWLESTLIDLDMNLSSVTRLENGQQGFMETWNDLFNGIKGNRVLVLRDVPSQAPVYLHSRKGEKACLN